MMAPVAASQFLILLHRLFYHSADLRDLSLAHNRTLPKVTDDPARALYCSTVYELYTSFKVSTDVVLPPPTI